MHNGTEDEGSQVPAVSLDRAQDWAAEFDRLDTARKDFIQQILQKLAQQQSELGDLRFELEAAQGSRINYQKESQRYKESWSILSNRVGRNSFVAVLVDADGAKFLDSDLQDPERGGANAALKIKQAVRHYLAEHDPHLLRDDLPIIVKLWANFDGLANALWHNGSIKDRAQVHRFAESFSCSRAESDFVNVGKGKENADSKLRKMFSFYYNNVQCRKIFFAGLHDTGYIHDLQEKRFEEGHERIVLLETTPAERPFLQLGFPVVSFSTVFRATPLNSETKRPLQNVSSSMPQHIPLRPAATTPPAQYASPPPQTQLTLPSVTPPITAQAAAGSTTLAGAEIRTSGSGGMSLNHSYASAGGTASHQNVVIAPAKKTAPAKVIYYNADEERLDPENKHPGMANPAQQTYQAKLEKVKPNMFCNEHYLAGSCSRGAELCSKIHKVRLTAEELAIHRYKARTSFCPRGAYCDRFDCYLSHHCPADPRCERRAKCRFDIHHEKKDALKPAYKWVEGNDELEPVGPSGR